MPNLQYIISRKQTGGQSEVLVRFYAGKVNQQAHTGIFAPAALWNVADGRCNISRRYETPENQKARAAQRRLDELADFIFEQYAADKLNIKQGWLVGVLERYNNPQPVTPPLHLQITDYCNARNVAPATRKKMLSLGTHLRNFAAAHRPLYAATLTEKDVTDFAAFLKYESGIIQLRSQNSISGRLRQLRTLVYWAGKPSPNPFDSYTIPTEVYGTPIYLTKEERDFLYQYNEFTPKKAIQRDIFIFQCHVGCRVSDLYALTPANIKDGWLVYVQQKTARENPRTIEVPLSATALEIVERYRNADGGGRLFPFISEPQYGKAITAICKQAALTRPVIVLDPITYESRPVPLWQVVTTHTARKTFAQIVYSQTTDKRLVASLTGHSENSQAFNRYSEISREMKERALQIL